MADSIATVRTKFNGKMYEIGETIPDMGSIVCVEQNGNVCSFEGLLADAGKLPTDVGATSKATLTGSNGTIAKTFLGGEWINM